MASYPPKQCCTIGVKHEGDPVGELIHVGETETYISHPPNKASTYDHAILILTDVIGHRFNNAQLIADQFAANGYFVAVPDLFHGDPLSLNRSPDFDFAVWRSKHGVEQVDPIVDSLIKELRSKYGVKKLGTVGYCFGAKSVVRFLKKGVTEAGFIAHPSFVDAEEVKALEGPLSIAAAETDGIFPPEKRHETEKILAEKKAVYQINFYSGVSHGFAVRADLKDPIIKYAKEQAFLQAVFWFDEHLKEDTTLASL